MARRIACVGEAMVELSLDAGGETAQIGFAGDTLNTAVYLARAGGAAHEVAFVSRVGRDSFSDRMIAFIENEGVSTSQMARDDERLPGLYAISTDKSGERSFSYWRENSAARLLFQGINGPDFSALNDFEIVYMSAITLAILQPDTRAALMDWIADFRGRGGLFAFDSNYRPGLWESADTARDSVSRAWALCDIGMPSVDDEMALFGDPDPEAALARLNASGIVAGALKRGAEGPVPINAAADPAIRFAPAAKVVDTTAAGDSFNGAFLAAFLAGRPLDEAMQAGHDCASRVIGVRGAIIAREPA